ncbi:MAG TPA: hypothetical protein DDW36_01355 [Candidatus Magasanikbacteria bacterium]|nr:hypothetical protein [Candidatus Magasanikbacteria bacterium]
MFVETIKQLLNRLTHSPETRSTAPTVIPWVFYGWLFVMVISVMLLASALLVLYSHVYIPLQHSALAIAYQQDSGLENINVNLFEKTQERWQAKKQLPVKRNVPRNPFQAIPTAETPAM